MVRSLFSQRKRERELQEREAEGESFWTTRFAAPARAQIAYAFRDAHSAHVPFYEARKILLRARGEYTLTGENFIERDFYTFVDQCDDEAVPDVIEAMYAALDADSHAASVMFVSAVQEILRIHRIGYAFEGGQIVPFESKELHRAILEPALSLLRNPRFKKAEQAYRDALDELTGGKPGDAITDAGTALQEMLTELGCDGNSLGALLKSARSKGLVAAHDRILTDAIEWASADRSETGDAHKAEAATVEDAWLAVHVVGAVMVRLAGPQRSGISLQAEPHGR